MVDELGHEILFSGVLGDLRTVSRINWRTWCSVFRVDSWICVVSRFRRTGGFAHSAVARFCLRKGRGDQRDDSKQGEEQATRFKKQAFWGHGVLLLKDYLLKF